MLAPVLARLNAIDGVESSSASVGNPDGGLVRVSLRPNANRAKIAIEVQRVLSEAVRDHSPVPLPQPAAALALQQKEWLNPQQLTDLAAADLATADSRSQASLVMILLGVLLVLLGLFGWVLLRRRRASSSDPRSGLLVAP